MCVVVGVLTLLNIVPNISEDVTRSAVLIGCGISAFFLIIVCLCCSCNCLRIDHAIIDTTYDRNGRGHKSSKSRRSTRSNRSNRSHRSHRLQIENLEWITLSLIIYTNIWWWIWKVYFQRLSGSLGSYFFCLFLPSSSFLDSSLYLLCMNPQIFFAVSLTLSPAFFASYFN